MGKWDNNPPKAPGGRTSVTRGASYKGPKKGSAQKAWDKFLDTGSSGNKGSKKK